MYKNSFKDDLCLCICYFQVHLSLYIFQVKILNKFDFEVISSYQHPDSIESNDIVSSLLIVKKNL